MVNSESDWMDVDTSSNQRSQRLQLLYDKLIQMDPGAKYKIQSLAITIQSISSDDFYMLVQLFEFYIQRDMYEMALDLFENVLLKSEKHDLFSNSSPFEHHLNLFVVDIVKNLSNKPLHRSYDEILKQSVIKSGIYFKIFIKSSQTNQEKFIGKILEKLMGEMSFLKVSGQTLDIYQFYESLSRHKFTLFKLRDLLIVYSSKFISDYGLNLIDMFINAEKTLTVSLSQLGPATPQFDPEIISVERKSLNILRRIFLVDLVVEFLHLFEKLDNRHCYRWIEKSLEFFTKYVWYSGRFVETGGDSLIEYSEVKLLHDCELMIGESIKSRTALENESNIEQIKQELSEFLSFKYEPKTSYQSTPFYMIYSLLDGIGKNLEWPALNKIADSNVVAGYNSKKIQNIEHKISFLFALKQKLIGGDQNVTKLQIVQSLLNKQIAFFSLAYFFQRLTEFNSISKKIYPNGLVLVSERFEKQQAPAESNLSPIELSELDLDERSNLTATSNLITCIKLWEKMEQLNEIKTLVKTCVKNCKLDVVGFYKSFISDYYQISYSAAINELKDHDWTSLANFRGAQKIPILAYLFMNEKKSFEPFFKELNQIIGNEFQEPMDQENQSNQTSYFEYLRFSGVDFNIFEFNKSNVLRYFSSLIFNKLAKSADLKKMRQVLSESDQFIGSTMFLIQLEMNSSLNATRACELYEFIMVLIKSKKSFEFEEFTEYIYDIKLLQRISVLASDSDVKLKLSSESSNSSADLIHSQIRNNLESKKFDLFEAFLNKKQATLTNLFDRVLN